MQSGGENGPFWSLLFASNFIYPGNFLMLKWIRRLFVLLGILILIFSGIGFYLYLKRDTLVKDALASLKRETGALVSVKSADFAIVSTFPDFAIELNSVVITDSNITIHQSPLLKLERMDLKASLTSLLVGNIRVQSVHFSNGTFAMEKYDDSTSNFLFFDRLAEQQAKDSSHKDTQDDEPIQLKIKKLVWENVLFDYHEIASEKHIKLKLNEVSQRVTSSDSAIHFTFKGNLHIDMLGFNLDKGAFLSNSEMEADFALRWVPGQKKLVWDGSSFKANGHLFQVNGNVVVAKPAVIDLRISTQKILEKDVLPLLTRKVADKLKLYEASGPIDAEAVISGPLYPGEDPEVRVDFEGSNQKFTAHLMEESFYIEHFKGYFYNHIDTSQMPGDPNSRLYISHVEGRWHEFPFIVSGDIRDFDEPFLNGSIQIPLNQKQIALLCENTPFLPIQSMGWMKAKFSGYIDDLISSEKSYGISAWKGNAFVQVKEGQWKESSLRFKDVEMKCRIEGDALYVQNLAGKLNGNAVSANGSMKGLASHIGDSKKPVIVQLSAFSKRFNLNPLLQGREDKQTDSNPVSQKPGASATYNFAVHLALKADHVLFRKLDCSGLACQFNLENNNLQLRNLQFKAGGGEVKVTSGIEDIASRRKKLQSEIYLTKVDIRQLLRGMDQFGQQILRPDHIEGKLDLDAAVTFHLNQNFDPQMETTKGKVSFQLRKARLLKFQPLMDVSNFILPKESLEEVDLATVGTTLHLYGRKMSMEELEIPTSLATFYLQGEYDFGDNLDMDILIPIHTISRKNQNEVIRRGSRDKDKPSIPIHVFKKGGKTKFELDVGRVRRRFWKRVKNWTK